MRNTGARRANSRHAASTSPTAGAAAAARSNLAGAYAAAGDWDRAASSYERVLADFRRALGKEHPLTETVRKRLAAVRAG
ncbi:tetratricopeptide repeat protein [Streptomyces catenulae]|uniref:Tetratricopeptide repeat protein n=1 Tax=Streptomyces catenulae TaxID=66875 RepID=A0ABV2Z217_9ACTN|nr:tetratricopeptide repeat protein [Streptomyces catenulae]